MHVCSWRVCAMKWKRDVPGGAAATGRLFWSWALATDSHSHLLALLPPPPHSSALLSHNFLNGDRGTRCWGLCGRVSKGVIWSWVMQGLINRSKSWPWRPGQGEILPLTSDLWHSGICACGSQHEIHVTSNSLHFCMQSSLSLKQRTLLVFFADLTPLTVLFESQTWRP